MIVFDTHFTNACFNRSDAFILISLHCSAVLGCGVGIVLTRGLLSEHIIHHVDKMKLVYFIKFCKKHLCVNNHVKIFICDSKVKLDDPPL